jgi:hypothetical protein
MRERDRLPTCGEAADRRTFAQSIRVTSGLARTIG